MIPFKDEHFLRQCRYCGNTFITNHGNRQFCHPEDMKEGQRDCKVTFNNLKARERRNATKVIHAGAMKNLFILERLHNAGKTAVSGDVLRELGLKMEFITGITRLADGTQIPHYYHFRLHSIGNNEFKVEKI